jgi:hypothetical protein
MPMGAEALSFSKCQVDCCFCMEPNSVKYRSMYVTGLDERGEFSASEHNTLGTFIDQFADNVGANTTGGGLDFAITELIKNNLMDSINIILFRHKRLDSEAVSKPFLIERFVHHKSRPQQPYSVQPSSPDGVASYINNVKQRQANLLLYAISNFVHSVCADYKEVGTGLLNSVACIDKNTGCVIPETLMLSPMNLIKIQAIKNQAG